tara:strand:+ start:19 stop:228 length:210 start_codon:yes stop_codon:yes gene_type:complete
MKKITVKINDEVLELNDNTSLYELLKIKDYENKNIATALNSNFISKELRSKTKLKDGDKVSIFSPITGG